MEFFKDQYVSGQGNRLAVYRAGVAGPAIFVIGGLTRLALPQTDLGQVVGAATNLGARVTLMDLPGTGNSALAGKSTMQGMLKDIAEVYDRYVGEPAIWIGSSMGGWLMLVMHRENPGWFRGMCALAPAIDWDANHLLPGRDAGLIKVTPDGGLQLAAMVVPHVFVESMAPFRIGTSPYALKVPLHIIHGAQDDVVPASAATDFAARHGPLCTIKLLAGEGHEVGKLKSDQSVLAFARWLKAAIASASGIASGL